MQVVFDFHRGGGGRSLKRESGKGGGGEREGERGGEGRVKDKKRERDRQTDGGEASSGRRRNKAC